MTFGKIKSIIENNLIESYKNEKDFKKSIREFKHNILMNKQMSKVYALYDQLSTPQGLNESNAKEFLEEGVNLIQKLLTNIKLPKTLLETIENKYSDLDTIIYSNKLNISERIQSKKNVINILMSDNNLVKESINIPIKSMVNIANQTLSSYIENLDESTKKEFLLLISEDTKSLVCNIKESAVNKLKTILEKEEEFELKSKISETIDRVKNEKFDQLNYLKLKNLEESI